MSSDKRTCGYYTYCFGGAGDPSIAGATTTTFRRPGLFSRLSVYLTRRHKMYKRGVAKMVPVCFQTYYVPKWCKPLQWVYYRMHGSRVIFIDNSKVRKEFRTFDQECLSRPRPNHQHYQECAARNSAAKTVTSLIKSLNMVEYGLAPSQDDLDKGMVGFAERYGAADFKRDITHCLLFPHHSLYDALHRRNTSVAPADMVLSAVDVLNYTIEEIRSVLLLGVGIIAYTQKPECLSRTECSISEWIVEEDDMVLRTTVRGGGVYTERVINWYKKDTLTVAGPNGCRVLCHVDRVSSSLIGNHDYICVTPYSYLEPYHPDIVRLKLEDELEMLSPSLVHGKASDYLCFRDAPTDNILFCAVGGGQQHQISSEKLVQVLNCERVLSTHVVRAVCEDIPKTVASYIADLDKPGISGLIHSNRVDMSIGRHVPKRKKRGLAWSKTDPIVIQDLDSTAATASEDSEPCEGPAGLIVGGPPPGGGGPIVAVGA